MLKTWLLLTARGWLDPVLPGLSLGIGWGFPQAASELRGLSLTQAKGGKRQERGQDTQSLFPRAL